MTRTFTIVVAALLMLLSVEGFAAKSHAAKKGKPNSTTTTLVNMWIYYCPADTVPGMTTCVERADLGVPGWQNTQTGPVQYTLAYDDSLGTGQQDCLNDRVNQWNTFLATYFTGKEPWYYPVANQCIAGDPTYGP